MDDRIVRFRYHQVNDTLIHDKMMENLAEKRAKARGWLASITDKSWSLLNMRVKKMEGK